MSKAQIAAIQLIANNKKGEAINLAVINCTNGTRIVRNVKQLVTDLEGSFRLIGVNAEFITSVKHPALQKAVSKLRGGTIEGTWTTFKEGEEYKVTENMSVITDSTHPEYGKFKAGDLKVHTADGTVVDGFLNLAPSMIQASIEEGAEALALVNAQAMGLFDNTSSANASSAAGADSELPDFDESVLDAAIGSKEPAKK